MGRGRQQGEWIHIQTPGNNTIISPYPAPALFPSRDTMGNKMPSTGCSVSYWFPQWLCPSQPHVLRAIRLAKGIFTEAVFWRGIMGHWPRSYRNSCHTAETFPFPFPLGQTLTINSLVLCSSVCLWFEYPLNQNKLQKWEVNVKWACIKKWACIQEIAINFAWMPNGFGAIPYREY